MKKAQIVSDPKIFGGKPVIAGTRISVELILDRVASGMSRKEILEDYPHITSEQVEAAVIYAKNLVRRTVKPYSIKNQSATLYTHEISR